MRSLSLSKSPGIVKEPQPLDFIPAPAFAARERQGRQRCENSKKWLFATFLTRGAVHPACREGLPLKRIAAIPAAQAVSEVSR